MMNLRQKQIHESALRISREYKNSEAKLISILREVESAKVCLELGYSSNFEYAVEELKLSEANAYSFCRIARKSLFVPELLSEIENGNLSVSNAKQIASLITPGNKAEWIEKACKLSKRELEKEILREHPESSRKESIRAVSEDRVSLKLEISEELVIKLRRAQVLLSQKRKRPVSLEETLEATVELFNEKNDPVQKAERIFPGKKGMVQIAKRRNIPAHIRHAVFRRDRGQCTYTSSEGHRCSSPFFIEIHHRRPIGQGGAHSLENLTTLCHQHHSYHHDSTTPPLQQRFLADQNRRRENALTP